jgi:hypothetical protein
MKEGAEFPDGDKRVFAFVVMFFDFFEDGITGAQPAAGDAFYIFGINDNTGVICFHSTVFCISKFMIFGLD